MSADSHSHDGAGVPPQSRRRAVSAVGPSKSREKAIAGRRAGASKTGILITGMHRSGTSALARVFNLLGCDLPNTLMPAGEANEPGHWESLAIANFNDEIFVSAGLGWSDWLPFGSEWAESPRAGQFRERAVSLLEQEFAGSRFLVLKDPRICRLLPFWLSVLEAGGYDPAIVTPTRNPLEVAASLAARDGMHPNLGQLLWLRYVLEAERNSRGRSRFYCSYDQLLHAWPQLIKGVRQSLGLTFSRMSPHVQEEIETFLGDKHRHHRQTRDSVSNNPLLSTWLRDTYDVFDRWCTDGEQGADHATLDRVLAEFDAAAPAFARPIAFGLNAASKVKSLETELNLARAAHQENERLTGEMHTLHVALAERHEVIQRLTQERDEARMVREAAGGDGATSDEVRLLREEIAEAKNQLIARDDKLTALALERDAVEAQLVSERERAAARVKLEAQAVEALDESAQAHSRDLAAKLVAAEARNAELESKLAAEVRQKSAIDDEHRKKIEVLSGQVAEAQRAAHGSDAALADERRRLVQAEEAARTERVRHEERINDLVKEVTELAQIIQRTAAEARQAALDSAAELGAAHQENSRIQAETRGATETISDLRELVDSITLALQERDRQLAALREHISAAEKEASKHREEIAILTSLAQGYETRAPEFAAASKERDALAADLASVSERLRAHSEDAASAMAAMQRRLAEGEAAKFEALALAAEAQQEVILAKGREAEARMALESAVAGIVERDRALSELQDYAGLIEGERDARGIEIAALTNLVHESERAMAEISAREIEALHGLEGAALGIVERDGALAELKALLADVEAERDKRQADIAILTDLLSERDGVTADLRVREAGVHHALAKATSDIVERDRIIAEMQAQIASMTAQGEARTAEIATLVGLVRDGEQAMAAAAVAAAEAQLALEGAAQGIAARDRSLADLREANEGLEQLRNELESQRYEQNGEIIALSVLVRSSEEAAASAIARGAELEVALNAGAERLSEREAALASMQALVGSLESRQAELFDEIAVLSKLLQTAEAAAQGDAAALGSLQEEVAVLESVVAAATVRANESEADMQQVSQYFVSKNAELTDLRRELDRARATAEWTRQIAAVLLAGSRGIRGRLFLMLPGYASRAWVANTLKKRGLFDSEAYLKANQDVASAGANPLRHFVYFGLKEGRKRD